MQAAALGARAPGAGAVHTGSRGAASARSHRALLASRCARWCAWSATHRMHCQALCRRVASHAHALAHHRQQRRQRSICSCQAGASAQDPVAPMGTPDLEASTSYEWSWSSVDSNRGPSPFDAANPLPPGNISAQVGAPSTQADMVTAPERLLWCRTHQQHCLEALL